MLASHLASLHAALDRQVLRDHQPERTAEELEHYARMAWAHALDAAVSPHSCMDRYCPCHLALSEYEPEPLPGLRTVAGAPGSW